MMGLTWWRPWGTAMLHDKNWENRPWPLWKKLIGEPIALHEGKKYDKLGADWMLRNTLYVPPDPQECLEMHIIGVITFDEIVKTDERPGEPWLFGPYGWHRESVQALHTPIPFRGQQGLWNVPDDVEAQIWGQLNA